MLPISDQITHRYLLITLTNPRSSDRYEIRYDIRLENTLADCLEAAGNAEPPGWNGRFYCAFFCYVSNLVRRQVVRAGLR